MKVITGFILLLISSQAVAYVGPGLGIGIIGSIIGILGAVILAFIGLFWYPLKRRFKKTQHQDTAGNEEQQTVIESTKDNNSNISK